MVGVAKYCLTKQALLSFLFKECWAVLFLGLIYLHSNPCPLLLTQGVIYAWLKAHQLILFEPDSFPSLPFEDGLWTQSSCLEC